MLIGSTTCNLDMWGLDANSLPSARLSPPGVPNAPRPWPSCLLVHCSRVECDSHAARLLQADRPTDLDIDRSDSALFERSGQSPLIRNWPRKQ